MSAVPTVAITTAGPIGRAIASLVIARGWRVAIYHSELAREHAEMLVKELGADNVYTHVVEVGDWETFGAAVEATKAKFGGPSHAVISFDRWDGGGGGSLYIGGGQDNGVYDRVTANNTEAVYRAMRVLLPSMVAAKTGSIVLLGSRTERPWENAGQAIYVASKAAAVSLAATAAEEVRDHGVRVNTILLSVVDEPEARAAMPNFDPSRWVSPDSIAKVAAFLVSDDARGITGAVIPMFGRV